MTSCACEDGARLKATMIGVKGELLRDPDANIFHLKVEEAAKKR
jgi:hypothetical protein